MNDQTPLGEDAERENDLEILGELAPECLKCGGSPAFYMRDFPKEGLNSPISPWCERHAPSQDEWELNGGG